MSFFDYDDIYKEHFDKTIKFTMNGLTGDIEKDIQTLESTLKTLWDDQGLDWIGRGELYLTRNQASIAATEQILHELKEKLQ